MKTLEIIDKLVTNSRSVDSDFLTSKELNRMEAFIHVMYRLVKHYPDKPERRLLSEVNGFKAYIIALRLKVAKRGKVPRWYMNNKL